MFRSAIVSTVVAAALAVPAAGAADAPALTITDAVAGVYIGSAQLPFTDPYGWPSILVLYRISGDLPIGFAPGAASLTETASFGCLNKKGKTARRFTRTKTVGGDVLFWNQSIPQRLDEIGVSLDSPPLFIDTSSIKCPDAQTLKLRGVTFSNIVIAFPTLGLSATIASVVYTPGQLINLDLF